ncbi:MAG: hypothetical protein R3B13_12275 [Polyangiaceae bacterium]
MKIDRDKFRAAALALNAALVSGCDLADISSRISPEKPAEQSAAQAAPSGATDPQSTAFDRTGNERAAERGQNTPSGSLDLQREGQTVASPSQGSSKGFTAPTKEAGFNTISPTKETGTSTVAPTKETGTSTVAPTKEGGGFVAPTKEGGYKPTPAPAKEGGVSIPPAPANER